MKINDSVIKVKETNKKNLSEVGKKLVKRINDSQLKHYVIAEAVKASEETISRFMAGKDGYVTKRLCRDIDKYLTDKGY